MSERSGVEIDYCPTCRGVWLDRGELDKIVDRAVAPRSEENREEERAERREESNDDRHGQFGGERGRRSWLRDIFD
jgi:Zn-finger nucleic acid-binding protein